MALAQSDFTVCDKAVAVQSNKINIVVITAFISITKRKKQANGFLPKTYCCNINIPNS